MTQSPRNLVLLGFGALLAVGLSAVMDLSVSAHGGDTTQIHACVNPGGQLRVIAPDGSCLKNEVAVDWNPTGGGGQGAGALQVVGDDGNIVGQLDGGGVITQVAEADDKWFRIFPVNQEGFGDLPPPLHFDKRDCEGNSYLIVPTSPGTPLVQSAPAWNGLGWYAGETVGQLPVSSTLLSDERCLNFVFV